MTWWSCADPIQGHSEKSLTSSSPAIMPPSKPNPDTPPPWNPPNPNPTPDGFGHLRKVANLTGKKARITSVKGDVKDGNDVGTRKLNATNE